MSPDRKQNKRNELLEFVLSPQYAEYHKKFIQKEVRKVIQIIDDDEDIEAIEYEVFSDSDSDSDNNTDTEVDYDSDNDTIIAINKIFKKSKKSRQLGDRIMSMNFPNDDNFKKQQLIRQ
jgi:hypothetical protein